MLNTSKKIYKKITIIFSILLIITLTLFSVFETKNNTNELIANTYNDAYSGSTKLSNLYVKNHEGDFSFSSETYTYSLNIFSTLKSVEVVATPQDSNATVAISGNKYLSSSGAITITVSNGGNSTVYTINYTCTKTDVVTNFSLAKSGQAYPITSTGIYKLEVWGAAGGYRSTSSYGFGGYSIGFYNGVIGDTLYAFTGYRGANFVKGNGNYSYGGYNGGGTGGTGNQGGSGGGGASHIAINLKIN